MSDFPRNDSRGLDGNLRAHDGDTLYAENGDGLRILGPDTYENGMPGDAEAALVANKYANSEDAVTLDSGENGYYGRMLGDRQDITGRKLGTELSERMLAVPGTSATAEQIGARDFTQLSNIFGVATAQQMQDEQAYDDRNVKLLGITRELADKGRQGSKLKYDKNFHEDAWDRGVDQVQQMGHGTAKLAADMLGMDTLSRTSQEAITDNAIEMLFNPRQTKSFTESEGFGETAESLYESLIEQAPNIGVTIATSIGTGGLGAATKGLMTRMATREATETALLNNALFQGVKTEAKEQVNKQIKRRAVGVSMKEGFTTGQKIGAGVSAASMNIGETKIAFDEAGVDANSKVLLTGLAKSALDMVGLSQIPGVNRLVGMSGRRMGLSPREAMSYFKKVPLDLAKSIVSEGSTEAMQAALDIQSLNSSTGKDWDENDTNAVIESGVVGGVAGGGFGAPTILVGNIGNGNKDPIDNNDPTKIEDTSMELSDEEQAELLKNQFNNDDPPDNDPPATAEVERKVATEVDAETSDEVKAADEVDLNKVEDAIDEQKNEPKKEEKVEENQTVTENVSATEKTTEKVEEKPAENLEEKAKDVAAQQEENPELTDREAAGENTVGEDADTIAAQLDAMASGKKSAVWVSSDKADPAASAGVAEYTGVEVRNPEEKDENLQEKLHAVEVNVPDGQRGVMYFRTRNQAVAYAEKVNSRAKHGEKGKDPVGIENAAVLYPEGTKDKSELNPKTMRVIRVTDTENGAIVASVVVDDSNRTKVRGALERRFNNTEKSSERYKVADLGTESMQEEVQARLDARDPKVASDTKSGVENSVRVKSANQVELDNDLSDAEIGGLNKDKVQVLQKAGLSNAEANSLIEAQHKVDSFESTPAFRDGGTDEARFEKLVAERDRLEELLSSKQLTPRQKIALKKIDDRIGYLNTQKVQRNRTAKKSPSGRAAKGTEYAPTESEQTRRDKVEEKAVDDAKAERNPETKYKGRFALVSFIKSILGIKKAVSGRTTKLETEEFHTGFLKISEETMPTNESQLVRIKKKDSKTGRTYWITKPAVDDPAAHRAGFLARQKFILENLIKEITNSMTAMNKIYETSPSKVLGTKLKRYDNALQALTLQLSRNERKSIKTGEATVSPEARRTVDEVVTELAKEHDAAVSSSRATDREGESLDTPTEKRDYEYVNDDKQRTSLHLRAKGNSSMNTSGTTTSQMEDRGKDVSTRGQTTVTYRKKRNVEPGESEFVEGQGRETVAARVTKINKRNAENKRVADRKDNSPDRNPLNTEEQDFEANSIRRELGDALDALGLDKIYPGFVKAVRGKYTNKEFTAMFGMARKRVHKLMKEAANGTISKRDEKAFTDAVLRYHRRANPKFTRLVANYAKARNSIKEEIDNQHDASLGNSITSEIITRALADTYMDESNTQQPTSMLIDEEQSELWAGSEGLVNTISTAGEYMTHIQDLNKLKADFSELGFLDLDTLHQEFVFDKHTGELIGFRDDTLDYLYRNGKELGTDFPEQIERFAKQHRSKILALREYHSREGSKQLSEAGNKGMVGRIDGPLWEHAYGLLDDGGFAEQSDSTKTANMDSTKREIGERSKGPRQTASISSITRGLISDSTRDKIYKALNEALSASPNGTLTKRDILKALRGIPGGHALSALFQGLPDDITLKINRRMNAEGSFTLDSNSIEVKNYGGEDNGTSIIHELIHAISEAPARIADIMMQLGTGGSRKEGISKGRKVARESGVPEKVINAAIDLLEAFHAIEDKGVLDGLDVGDVSTPSEMVAVVMSDPVATKAANNTEMTTKAKSKVKKFYAKVLAALSNLMGFRKDTALERMYTALVVSEPSNRRDQRMTRSAANAAENTAYKGGLIRGHRIMYRLTTPRGANALKGVVKGFKKLLSSEGRKGIHDKGLSMLKSVSAPINTSYRRLSNVSNDLATQTKKWYDNFQSEKSILNNMYSDATHGFSQEEIEAGLAEVISGNPPKTQVGQNITTFLADMGQKLQRGASRALQTRLKDIANKFPFVPNAESIAADLEGFTQFLTDNNFRVERGGDTVSTKDNPILAKDIAMSMAGGDPKGRVTTRPGAGMFSGLIKDPNFQAMAQENGWMNSDPVTVISTAIDNMTKIKAFDSQWGGFMHATGVNGKPIKGRAFLESKGYDFSNVPAGKIEAAVAKILQGMSDKGLIKVMDTKSFSNSRIMEWQSDARQEQVLSQIGREGGNTSDAKKTLSGIIGSLGNDMATNMRRAMQWGTVAQAYALLALSTISSIPELGVNMALMLSKDPKSTFKALGTMMKYIAEDLSEVMQRVPAKDRKRMLSRLSRITGTVTDSIATVAYSDASAFDINGNGPKKWMERMFKWNGNQMFANMNRALTTEMGKEYFTTLARKGDTKTLKRWGVTPAEIKAWVASGFTVDPANPKNGAAVDKVNAGLLRFVDRHVARPTSLQKPVIGNDPRFMLFTQLKTFFYSYGASVIPEMAATMADIYDNASAADKPRVLAALKATAPLILLGLFAAPLGILSREIKAAIRDTDDDQDRIRAKQSIAEQTLDIIRGTGILGPADLVAAFVDAEGQEKSGIVRTAGPTADFLDTVFKHGVLDPRTLKRGLPVIGTVAPYIFDASIKEAQKQDRADKKAANK